MSNYAERLAYWFLRLNGFFILENYVIDSYNSKAEHDLLAVRLPYAREAISGVDIEHHALFGEGELAVCRKSICGLVVQVKGGGQLGRRQYPGNAFRRERIEHAIRRVGLFSDPEEKEAFDALTPSPTYKTNSAVFAKLFMAERVPDRPESYISISLRDVDEYVVTRLRQATIKQSHWHYFHDPFAQYIILRNGRRARG